MKISAADAAQRRMKVVQAKHLGKTAKEIAAELGVSTRIVFRDLQALTNEFREKAGHEFDDMLAQELGHLVHLRRNSIASFAKSSDDGKAPGDARFLDVWLRTSLAIQDLLGLDDLVRFNSRRGLGADSTTVKTEIVEVVVNSRDEIETLKNEDGNYSFAVYQKLMQSHESVAPAPVEPAATEAGG